MSSVWFLTQLKGLIQHQVAAELGQKRTCAANISDSHAEDEAGLVSFSFSLFHHVHGEVAIFGAILM